MKKTAMLFSLALLGAVQGTAQAEVAISGFGQFVAGQTTSKGEVFRERNYTDELELKEESLLAIQVDADITGTTRAVGQIVARGYDDYDAELAWAYLHFEMGNGWSAKVGRQRTPTYRYSDFLDVGYAYPWIRQPVWLYYVPWNNVDGASVTHSASFGKWYSRLQVLAGAYTGDIRLNGLTYGTKFDDILSISWEVDYDEWLSLRAAYMPAHMVIKGTSFEPLLPILTSIGKGQLARNLDIDGDRAKFMSVGATVDRNNWLLVGEYAEVDIENSILPKNETWYVAGGYRIGQFVPYLTYGRREAVPRLQLLANLPVGHPLRNVVAGALMTQAYDETYYTAGVRWDVMEKVALKADWTRNSTDLAGRIGSTLVSAGVTFTF